MIIIHGLKENVSSVWKTSLMLFLTVVFPAGSPVISHICEGGFEIGENSMIQFLPAKVTSVMRIVTGYGKNVLFFEHVPMYTHNETPKLKAQGSLWKRS